MRDPLEALARQAAEAPFFLAPLLQTYARSEDLDDAGLARALGCAVGSLALLRLCRAPRSAPAEFQHDVGCIADRFGIDPARLAEVVKHGRVVQRLRQRSATPGSTSGFLMAARDQDPPEES